MTERYAVGSVAIIACCLASEMAGSQDGVASVSWISAAATSSVVSSV